MSDNKDDNLDKYFLSFINAFNNYELELTNLLHKVVIYYINVKRMNYDNAYKIYDEIMSLIVEHQLECSTDLTDPINDIYNDYICFHYLNKL